MIACMYVPMNGLVPEIWRFINYSSRNNNLSCLCFQIEHLQQQSIVGLSVEGVDVGRYGHLCWLQVSSTYKARFVIFL